MSSYRPLRSRSVWFMIILAIGVGAAYFMIRDKEVLPVYGPRQVRRDMVDPEVFRRKGPHFIDDFRLTDQQGRPVSLADLKGRVIVADFFFTTCATICPRMTAEMERVQDAYSGDTRIVLLSHSVTPEIDSVAALAAYAELHDADPRMWHFLTGDRKHIYDLARRSYFVALDEGDGGPNDFVHTENFVLVDTLRRIRGYYDGTSAKDVDRLIQDIEKLLQEEPMP